MQVNNILLQWFRLSTFCYFIWKLCISIVLTGSNLVLWPLQTNTTNLVIYIENNECHLSNAFLTCCRKRCKSAHTVYEFVLWYYFLQQAYFVLGKTEVAVFVKCPDTYLYITTQKVFALGCLRSLIFLSAWYYWFDHHPSLSRVYVQRKILCTRVLKAPVTLQFSMLTDRRTKGWSETFNLVKQSHHIQNLFCKCASNSF